MGIENIINNSGKGMRSAAIVGVLAATGVGCTTMDKRDESSQEFAGIPAENIGHYETRERVVLPRFSLDGQENKYFLPKSNESEHLQWMDENISKTIYSAQCPDDYSKKIGLIETSEGGSSYVTPLCEKK